MTKTLSLASLLSLSLAACGAVSDATDDLDGGDDISADVGPLDNGIGLDDSAPTPPHRESIVLEEPRAATTSSAIAAMGKADRRATADFILGAATRDVSEQRFVTVSDQSIHLSIEFASPPRATASRTLSSDVGAIFQTNTVNIQCTSSNNTIDLGNEMCDHVTMVPETNSVTRDVASATWSLGVLDEETNALVAGCQTANGVLSCELGADAGHAYRVVTRVTKVSELWDGGALTAYTTGATPFIGRPEYSYYCASGHVVNGNWWCQLTYEYQRSRGLDNASLAFGDIDVAITADGTTKTSSATQLS